MALWCLLFGQPLAIAQLLGIDPHERVPPNLFLDRRQVVAATG
jgi:hypothetical protein